MSYSLNKETYTKLVIALCCIANFINAADRVIMPIAIISISDHFDWDLHQHGWILSAFSTGYFCSMIIGGSAAKRFGGAYVLLFAVFLWSLSSIITPIFAFSTETLVILRLLLGVGEGIGLPTIFHIFAFVVPSEERSRALGYLIAFGSIGQTVATLVAPHLYWSYLFYLFGIAGFIWILLWFSVFRYVQNECRVGAYTLPLQVRSANPSWITFISSWSLWSIYIAHFSMNWSNYIVMQWLPTYLVRYLGASKNEIMFTAIPYLSNSVASIVAGHMADNLIRKQYNRLMVRRLLSFIGLIGPGILFILFSATGTIYTAVIFISISMALSAFNSAGHLSNHGEVAPNHAGITFAISNTIATIPGILCGPLTAHIVVHSGGRWFPVYILAGLINVVGAIIYTSQSSVSQII